MEFRKTALFFLLLILLSACGRNERRFHLPPNGLEEPPPSTAGHFCRDLFQKQSEIEQSYALGLSLLMFDPDSEKNCEPLRQVLIDYQDLREAYVGDDKPDFECRQGKDQGDPPAATLTQRSLREICLEGERHLRSEMIDRCVDAEYSSS